MNTTVDQQELRTRVQSVYQAVAETPRAAFHFELGRSLAQRLGYPEALLERIPDEAVESFAGVGYHNDLAGLVPGESVLDLGSGSGTDAFAAAVLVGPTGTVTGLDMTAAQRSKAAGLAARHGFHNTRFAAGYIEEPPFEDGSFDCIISNGVINLASDKAAVFREAHRMLRPGGRLALSDIVTREHLPESVVCNASMWAACIGGAMERAAYLQAIEAAGFAIHLVRLNPQYTFLSGRAQGASRKWGVISISLVAVKD